VAEGEKGMRGKWELRRVKRSEENGVILDKDEREKGAETGKKTKE